MSAAISVKSILKVWALATTAAASLFFCLPDSARAAESETVLNFNTPVNPPQHQCTDIDYTVDYRTSKCFVYVPSSYIPSQPFGLIVYISPGDTPDRLPDGWKEVLERRKLLFVAPQNAGNSTPQARRCGLSVLAALEMMRNYNVDKSRVYAAGLSGGARSAGDLGMKQSDLFCGTIQSCGTDFYKDVPRHYATSDVDTAGNHYGVVQATPSEVADARNKTKFVLITGNGDFRRGNILDIYYGGFAADRFRVKLLDIAGMGHQDCDTRVLEQALDYLK
jgi:hypothetical protein